MRGSMSIRTLIALVLAVAPVVAYSPNEEHAIRRRAEAEEGVEEARPVLAPGVLSSSSHSLAAVMRVFGTPEATASLVWLSRRSLLPESGQVRDAKEGHEASGRWSQIAHPVFRPGRLKVDAPFYLYDPAEALYRLGGLMAKAAQIEILVDRTDGTLAATRSDGTVVFLDPKAVERREGPGSPPTRPPAVVSPGPEGWSHQRLKEGGALVHLITADASKLAMSVAVSPYYNALAPGPERTLYVDQLARLAQARLAINGTFFIDKSTNPQYGFPIGSAAIGGKVAWNLTAPALLKMDRSFAAFTDDGRLVIGNSPLPGREILAANPRFGSLLTGLGWLVKARNADAWKAYVGRQFDPSYYSRNSRRARSLVGADATGRRMFLVAEEEGELSPQPMSLPELASYLVGHTGIHDLAFLDGGGSTQLVIEGKTVTQPYQGAFRKNSTALTLIRR
jgi:exopolysaccharide biosynthesis protein